jgi:hypothetical protein
MLMCYSYVHERARVCVYTRSIVSQDCLAELEKLYLNYERPYFANVSRMGRNNPN